VVYSREIDERALRLAPSGWTYGEIASTSVFVLMDKETESVWFPRVLDGRQGLVGIGGSYADRMQEKLYDLEVYTWQEWKGLHPGTKIVRE
jgi:hypothetical protein